jgi:hypothetical protein
VTQRPNREDSCTERTLLDLDEAVAAMRAAGLDPLVLAQPALCRGGKIFTKVCDFSNSVSSREALKCDDARRLTRSPRRFVSRSCPLFTPPILQLHSWVASLSGTACGLGMGHSDG